MKTLYYILMMAIASGLLIFALVNTNYNDPLEFLIFDAAENEPNNAPFIVESQDQLGAQIRFLDNDQIGDFKFKLTNDQLRQLDCSVIGPGTETYVIINDELYVFECPDGYD